MFEGRNLLIATKHQKERVIAPLFQTEFGVHCFTSEVFDTDSLGTFSGEIDRKDDALTTLRNKCKMAMNANHCDLAIASEGSFGAHPTIFFAHADHELLLLIDAKNELEILVQELSTETNFDGKLISIKTNYYLLLQKINSHRMGLF